MAVTKALIKAVPYEKSSQVDVWDLEMKYENNSEGDATYYTFTFSLNVEATDDEGVVNFAKKAKGLWSRSELEALCPTSQWDNVFASQVDSVITRPVTAATPDESFPIPS
tara:strand:- start:391 stop:720 length:330 start_codon:yes stop_codon:yes gene_type:complete